MVELAGDFAVILEFDVGELVKRVTENPLFGVNFLLL